MGLSAAGALPARFVMLEMPKGKGMPEREIPLGGKSTLRTRQKALDRVFGEWIRRKDADSNGMVRCVTCGAAMHWKEANAGHFWKRQHQATRYDPKNVNVQCPRDNLFRGGAEAEHAAYILKIHGDLAFWDLEYRHRQIKKWTRDEIESMLEDYKQKLAELE
jgi:hypothetical protein